MTENVKKIIKVHFILNKSPFYFGSYKNYHYLCIRKIKKTILITLEQGGNL